MKFLYVFAVVVCYVVAVGEWKEVDTNDDEIQEVSKYAAKYASQKFRSPNHHKLVEVTKAKKQVVSGSNFEVKITVQETTCAKGDSTFEEAQECDVSEKSFPKYCTVRIWDKPWETKRTVTYFACTSRRS